MRQMLAKVLVLALCLGLLPSMAVPVAAAGTVPSEDELAKSNTYVITLSTDANVLSGTYTVAESGKADYVYNIDKSAINKTDATISLTPYKVDPGVTFTLAVKEGFEVDVLSVNGSSIEKGNALENGKYTVAEAENGTKVTFKAPFPANQHTASVNVTTKAITKQYEYTIAASAQPVNIDIGTEPQKTAEVGVTVTVKEKEAAGQGTTVEASKVTIDSASLNTQISALSANAVDGKIVLTATDAISETEVSIEVGYTANSTSLTGTITLKVTATKEKTVVPATYQIRVDTSAIDTLIGSTSEQQYNVTYSVSSSTQTVDVGANNTPNSEGLIIFTTDADNPTVTITFTGLEDYTLALQGAVEVEGVNLNDYVITVSNFTEPTGTETAYTQSVIVTATAKVEKLTDSPIGKVPFSGYRKDTVTTENETLTAGTGSNAVTITVAHEGDWIVGSNKFTVNSEDACTVIVKNVVYNKASYTRLEAEAATDAEDTFEFTAEFKSVDDAIIIVLKGDVNCDGVVNISDATDVISQIKGVFVDEYVTLISNVNGDKTTDGKENVNISDATAIISIIKGVALGW